jgi:hypothetical protein
MPNCARYLNDFNSWRSSANAAISKYQSKGSATIGDEQEFNQTEQEMLEASVCISEEVKRLSSSSNSIASLHEQIIQKTSELSQAEKDISIAKDRVAYIRHPERMTSHYENWFPINRPISIFSMILLTFITSFLLIFLIFLFLSYIGMNITMFSQINRERSGIMSFLFEQFTISFWLLLLAFISVIIYFVTRK